MEMNESNDESEKVKNWLEIDEKGTKLKIKQRDSSCQLDTSLSKTDFWDEANDQQVMTIPSPPGFSTVLLYNDRSTDNYPTYRSRWCDFVKQTKNSTKTVTFLNGDLRMSCTRLSDIRATDKYSGENWINCNRMFVG